MFAGPRDGETIQQREVIEPQHLDEPRRRALVVVEVEPAVELLLRQPGSRIDAGEAVIGQRRIVALGCEGDLVSQVSQSIVDRGRREHEHPGLHALADDPTHQPVVACLGALSWRALVAEVVRLVDDDDEVVVSPVDVGEVDVARHAAVARQVGVVEDVVVEAVARKEIAAVVGAVEAPVVAQDVWGRGPAPGRCATRGT